MVLPKLTFVNVEICYESNLKILIIHTKVLHCALYKTHICFAITITLFILMNFRIDLMLWGDMPHPGCGLRSPGNTYIHPWAAHTPKGNFCSLDPETYLLASPHSWTAL